MLNHKPSFRLRCPNVFRGQRVVCQLYPTPRLRLGHGASILEGWLWQRWTETDGRHQPLNEPLQRAFLHIQDAHNQS